MPRYFFDLTDGSREPDRVGTELPSHDDAEREAIRFLGEVLKGEPERLRADTLRVHVRNDDAGYQCVVVADIERPDR